MPFQNLVIQRTIIHEVFKRTDAPTPVDPSYGTQVIHLEADARDALQQRIDIRPVTFSTRKNAGRR